MATQRAPIQAATPVEEPVDTERQRKSHIHFIFEVYGLCTAMLVVALSPWIPWTNDAETAIYIWLFKYKSTVAVLIFVGFVMLVIFVRYFNMFVERSLVVAIIYALIMMEINSVMLLDSMLVTNYIEALQVAACSAVILLICFASSLVKHSTLFNSSRFIQVWTMRIYISVALTLPVSHTWGNPYFDMTFATVVLGCTSLFLICTSLSLGCRAFWTTETPHFLLFSTLYYFNMIVINAVGLMIRRHMNSTF